MKLLKPSLFALGLLAALSVQAAPDCSKADTNVELKRLLGKSENVCQTYGGQVLLVVNTASHCGYTPQYEGLEKLYKTKKEQGFAVLGFPSRQFMFQEFKDDAEIATFCKANFGVSFPLFARTDVKGDEANPLFKRLIAATGQSPKWNFNKYLIGRDGKVIKHFSSDVTPDSPELKAALDKALAAPKG
jgi:glutathione peroxidase